MFFPWAGLLWTEVARAACPVPSSTADIVSALDDAKIAYGNLDIDAFRVAMGRVHQGLPCLNEEATRHLAAELHRFEGLLGFLDRDADRSRSAFARSRSIEPNYRFPSSLVPEGNPVIKEYLSREPGKDGVVRVADPLSGRILFDGATTPMRPVGEPSLFQRMDAEGSVLETVYLWPADALPAYPASSAPVSSVTDPNAQAPDLSLAVRAGPNRPLLTSAGLSLLASGLLYGGAYLVHGRYLDPQTDVTRLDRLRSVNNGFVVASGATLTAAIGLGAGAMLTGSF